jgi:subfamily B ATP-binding cassette protein MsbA
MKNFKRLLKYLTPLWKRFVLGLVLMVIFVTFSASSIYMLKPVFDEILVKDGRQDSTVVLREQSLALQVVDMVKTGFRGMGGVARGEMTAKEYKRIMLKNKRDFFEFNDRKSILTFLCLTVVIMILIKNTVNYLQKLVFISLQEKLVMNVRNDVYRKLHEFSLPFFNRFKTGELISRVMNDINVIKAMVVSNLTEVIRNSLLVLVFGIIIVILNWRLTLIFIIAFPPMLLILGRLADKLKSYSVKAQSQVAGIISLMQETISGIRVVLAFAMKKYEIDRFKAETKRYYRIILKLIKYDILAAPLSEVITMAMGVVVFWYGANLIIGGDKNFSSGKFMAYLGFIFSMMQPIKLLNSTFLSFKKGMAIFGRVFEIMDEQPSIQEIPNAAVLKPFDSHIEYRNVSFSYNKEKEVLRNINLKVGKGEIIAIVGHSGGGKSTLVDLLPRFYDPVKGEIRIDGTDIRKCTLDSLRDKMGIVTQEVILFDDTVYNNIAYGKTSAERGEVEKAARIANAHDFIAGLEQGYETRVGERGVRLSGGEKQRLAIARAILKNPPILIFDEATSALDNESEMLVQKAIEKLFENRTTIVIAHRLSTIRNAHKILVIENGIITESGTHKELMQNNSVYKRLYDLQFKMAE